MINSDIYAFDEEKIRVPAYCDRIFYSKKKGVRVLSYNSIKNIKLSDHRPVTGAFRFNIGEDNEKKEGNIEENKNETDNDINGIENWRKGYVTCSINFDKHNLGVHTEFAKKEAKEGSIIEIIADLDRGELSFSLNGNNLGIFCDNIIKDIEYVPFVEIHKEGSEIQLL